MNHILKKQIPAKILADEKIIVTMTSWPKRINNVYDAMMSLFDNTYYINKFILNLSVEEFPNKEKDLPKKLLYLINSKKNVELYWVEKNTKPYKKLLPTIKRFPKDVIISVDDDIIYPKNFIESLYKEYLAYDRQCPITAGTYKWGNDIYTHYGCFSLVKKEFFGIYLDDLYNNLVLKIGIDTIKFSDPIFTYAALLNGKRYKFTNSLNMSDLRKKLGNDKYSISKFDSAYKKDMQEEHRLIKQYILEKYKKTYDQLFDAPIVVNLTTYPLRDKYLYEMLKNFSKQTKKPDEIVLYLAKTEYNPEKLPDNIVRCINDKLITKIIWVQKNIYCHKRHECFKFYNNCYNITVDDDILYDVNYVKNIYDTAKKYQSAVTTMSTYSVNYKNLTAICEHILPEKNLKNVFMGGCTCFPPFIYPLESFKYEKERDEYVQKCDEGWIRAFLIKYNIPIHAIYDKKDYKFTCINGSQETALWNENKFRKNGLREKERNFFNALKIAHVEKEAINIWSYLNIDDYKLCASLNDFKADDKKEGNDSKKNCMNIKPNIKIIKKHVSIKK